MRKLIWIKVSLLLITLVSFSACSGGGGGGEDPPPPEGSSNWDEMIWDQDNWE